MKYSRTCSIINGRQLCISSSLLHKFSIAFLLLTFLSFSGFGTNGTTIQTGIPSAGNPIEISLISSDIKTSTINCAVSSFVLEEVATPSGTSSIVDVMQGIPLYEKGAPDLRRISTSLVIPNRGDMEVKILSSTYKDYENIEIAPSKGVLMISDDASKIPYEYGPAYQKDAFYPGTVAELREAHIMRDVRGQVLDIYPFQYNPVTKTLRVYTSIKVAMQVNEKIAGANCWKTKVT